MTKRAVIGVTGPIKGGLTAWLMTAFALRRSGAIPLRITTNRPATLQDLDGIVIGGGTDVDPFNYGAIAAKAENTSSHHNSFLDWMISVPLGILRVLFASHSPPVFDPARDELEQSLIEEAISQKKPVLGICRGAQLMNVVLGGSLHQDISHFYSEPTRNIRSVLPRKQVTITPDSHLGGILNTQLCWVNALHNQSIDRLGTGVAISAQEANGVIQAIEERSQLFFIGVQWHPEYMPQSRAQLALFQGLVKCAQTPC
ncbi:MAG: gamma-glutamyl-gamma-aminobutyrate hydrolase family protein [Pseudomonadota bacterium]